MLRVGATNVPVAQPSGRLVGLQGGAKKWLGFDTLPVVQNDGKIL